MSRKGIEYGSITHHPDGIPHGPASGPRRGEHRRQVHQRAGGHDGLLPAAESREGRAGDRGPVVPQVVGRRQHAQFNPPDIDEAGPDIECSARGWRAPRGASEMRAQASDIPRLRIERYVLPNGLEVILHEDHSTPDRRRQHLVPRGIGRREAGPHRLRAPVRAHHVHGLASTCRSGQFDKWLEAAGANNNGSTTEDRTNYYESLPSNALPLALWLDADRMGWLLPTMDQAEARPPARRREERAPRSASTTCRTAVATRRSSPRSIRRTIRTHWPVIGSMTDLSAASLDDVKQFFRTYYAPNNATLVIAGDFARTPRSTGSHGTSAASRAGPRCRRGRGCRRSRCRATPSSCSRTTCSCRACSTRGTR